LCYLMIHQQDPVGLWVFDDSIKQSLAPKSRRSHLGTVLSVLAKLEPLGNTDVARCLSQIASILRRASLIMLFSDLLTDPEPVLQGLHRLKHRGHDIIVFHILDEAEVSFPFQGTIELEEPESGERLEVDAAAYRADYLEAVQQFRERYRRECFRAGIDYVPLDTSMAFDKALMEYLLRRRARF